MAEKSGELDLTEVTDVDRESETELDNRNDQKIETEESAEIADEPDAIRDQIGETRREMGETIDAIQEKLSIANISAQIKEHVTEHITDAVQTVKENVWDATIGKGGEFMKNIGGEIKRSNVGKMVGANPVPFVLMGLGIGMLVYNRYAKTSHRATWDDGNQIEPTFQQGSDGIAQTVGNAATSVYEGAGSAAGKVLDTAGSAAGTTYNKVGDLGGQVRGQYEYQLEENPLVVGAVALALGAAVGAMIPTTRYEGQLMGETRDSLISNAQTAAQDAIEKVQEVVGEAKDTIIEDAKDVVSQAKESLTGEIENAGRPASA